ncbi:MAG: ATP-binding protein [Gemmatimonadaceae bacterium]
MAIRKVNRSRDPARSGAQAAAALVWAAAGALALVAASGWLRELGIRYLAASAFATLAAAVAATRLPARARRWGLAFAAATSAMCLVGARVERRLARLDRDWPAYRAALARDGASSLAVALDDVARSLQATAAQAVVSASPAAGRPATASSGDADRGVVRYRAGKPEAWAGRIYVEPDSGTRARPLSAGFSTFYVTLEARATRGETRAVASAIVHSEAPADQLTDALDEQIARQKGLRGFAFSAASASPGLGGDSAQSRSAASLPPDASESFVFAPGGDTLFRVRPVPLGQGETRLFAEGRARVVGSAILALALALYLAASWAAATGSVWRLLAPLAVALACLAFVPLNSLSNSIRLFDPTVYFVGSGGPYTASVGSLLLAGVLTLLGMLVAIRARLGVANRGIALAGVLGIMGTGPFLLRNLSKGIATPGGGATVGLWLAWEVALFLAAATLLLGAAWAGSAALGVRRGLPPLTAPALAAIAAGLAPVVLGAPESWPGWYPALWIAAIGAVALTRRHRAMVMTAASVAALGATTLAWRADVRGRVQLAERDVASLADVDPFTVTLAERFEDALATADAPRSEAALLTRYVQSDLAGSANAVTLASWPPDGGVPARVALAAIPVRPDDELALVRNARARGAAEVRTVPGDLGVYLALAVPYADGTVVTALVAPRTRLIADDPYNALLGIAPRELGEPPYVVSLAPADSSGGPVADGVRWSRDGDEMHGSRRIRTEGGTLNAHIEVDLRSLDVLVQRGTLVVLLDLALMFALWALSISPSGAFRRWIASRRRVWGLSYRARLTVALFGFFVVPAGAFAAWSYRRLQADDLQSRGLLVREALRRVGEIQGDPSGAGQVRETLPVFVYRDGALRSTSDPLIDTLAPVGRLLPPEVYRRIVLGSEPEASRIERVGDRRTLFGYRALEVDGERVVIAAPARGNDEALDVRRRDLGVLVLFSTLLGALAALWLSGAAARSLARPIGRLRTAALSIAGGTLDPALLPEESSAEFVPVFSAFRRMAADLRESRDALEEAQRRTAAVLRNVASGVIAVEGSGLVLLANPRAEELVGRALPAGMEVRGTAWPELAATISEFLAGQADDEETDLERGAEQFHVRLTRLTRGGGGAVLTLDDVTELARAQRVLAWGEMARQVAHEIKNPLTPIRLGVQHLKRARADARADFDQILDRNVERILAEIDRLDQIARGFSRYGMAPAERATTEATDVSAVVRDVVELERLGQGAVEWQLQGTDAPALACARADELHEVLLNVLENARLAAARRVAVRVAREDGRVVMEVADDGHGVPAQVLPRIFEPHFSTRTSGSGLGLAISRQMIEGWGGQIAISSIEGEGTTVRIELRGS